MKTRIEDGITIQMLEHQAANPIPSGVPTNWDICVSHASEDKPYVDALVQKLTEAGIKVSLNRRDQSGGATFASPSTTV